MLAPTVAPNPTPAPTLAVLTDFSDPWGVLLRREALERGIDDNALGRLRKRGVLHRLRQGAYVLGQVWRDADEAARHRILCHAVVRLYGAGVALSHGSACVYQGGPTWGLALGDVHLTHLAGAGRRHSRIVHHHGDVGLSDVRRHDGAWVTVPGRAVLEVALHHGVETALVQADHFLRKSQTTVGELERQATLLSRWPHSLSHHLVVRLADGRHESPLETRTNYLFFVHGVPRPVPQLEVHDAEGLLIGRVDFAWPAEKVVVEVDGLVKYHRYRRPGETIEQMVVREKEREDRLREAGWTVIRLLWRDLETPQSVARRIRRALGLVS